MLYLSLWLASKFHVSFPVLPFHKRNFASEAAESRAPVPVANGNVHQPTTELPYRDYRVVGYLDVAAGPPTWLLFLIYIPVGVAVYITGSRFFEYYHHGFDVVFSSLFGIIAACIGFRWYHGPIGRSAGWAWSPRSRDRAFGVGVGSLGYVSDPPDPTRHRRRNVELGFLDV